MIRKTICLFLCLMFVLGMTACGKQTELKETDFYNGDILSGLREEPGQAGRLPGFADNLCVLPKDGFFDEDLIEAPYAGLFSETDKEVLYAKAAEEHLYPASMTKCMTALLVLENVEDLEEEVPVGAELREGLVDGSSLAGLIEGAYYTWRELLYALLIPSGNDAANTLAYHVGGSIQAFVDMMNRKAKDLGMLNTHFVNPHGLFDANHYTTVYDLYLLLNKLKDYPEFYECSAKMSVSISATIPGQDPVVHEYTSGNSYLRGYTLPPEGLHITAAKTGYTATAGRCLLLIVMDDEGNRYFAIVAKAASYDALYQQMNALLSFIGQ